MKGTGDSQGGLLGAFSVMATNKVLLYWVLMHSVVPLITMTARYHHLTTQENFMMRSKRSQLTYTLSTLVIGATLVLAAPVGAENPTTIDQSTQPHLKSWSNNIPTKRFVVLSDFSNQAVLDRETGLVWEQALELTTHAWGNATWYCVNKIVGGAPGWRLPSVVELKSVEDRTLPSPYINSVFNSNGILSANNWWSATTSGINAGDAWIVDIGGRVNGNSKTNGQGLAWCVRGPMNADTY